jgi:hypothetical protein
MASKTDPLHQALLAFAETLQRNFASRVAAQPEDQLKSPVQTLLKAIGKTFQLDLDSRTEAHAYGVVGRPDIGVSVGGLPSGFVELKAPGKGARTDRFRGADKNQWERFKAIDNLIYTDGSEWALYRFGERRGQVVQVGRDLTIDGKNGLDDNAASQLSALLRDFLIWEPVSPSSPKALADALAPLCHLLREEVLDALGTQGSGIAQLAQDWRVALFPEADDPQFADAYAQTVTYALLLARFEGETKITTDQAEQQLRKRHGLLAQALRVLAEPQVRHEIELGLVLLERTIRAIDLTALSKLGHDPWLYFYEDFLAKYDPKLRADRGVYYTPVEVILAQCRLSAQLLESRMGKVLSFADDGVVVLDPGCGTGAYLLAALQLGLDRSAAREGLGALPGRASSLAENLHGFEILVGPYAVAHLRLTQQLLDAGASLPVDGARIFLTDTLESPYAEPRAFAFQHRPLAEEHRRAQEVKSTTRVLVCMGNPPYDRQEITPDDEQTRRKGGWVRFGDQASGDQEARNPILDDFLRPARLAGASGHLKNLYNDYVYFWRWALWKVFETTEGPGIVTFISASSYLRGPGFLGMRQLLRELADEIWILDLEGGLGARKTENVFAIRTPVAIAIAVRYDAPNPKEPAIVHYTRVEGTRVEKLAQLAAVQNFESLHWQLCYRDWQKPFLPEGKGDYFTWQLLSDLFPWQHSGVQFKRTWPIAPTKETLDERWRVFLGGTLEQRALSFRETSARRVDGSYESLGGARAPRLSALPPETPAPGLTRYAFRSFDRQWALLDARFADRIRPDLVQTASNRQLFLTSLLSGVLGLGPAATVAANIPDLHHFRGSYGGKDVIPLFCDAAARHANVTGGLLQLLSTTYGKRVLAENLFAYAYALLASPAYVEHFSEELTEPGPRLPLTKDAALFFQGADLGSQLIFLHTFGQRSVPPGVKAGSVPHGLARSTKAVPATPDAYPDRFAYDGEVQTLQVGEGKFAPVPPEIWTFSLSGFEVVKSWLAFRMKDGAGRSSSPLDDIHPQKWSAGMTQELLELLWVLEATVALFSPIRQLFENVIAGPVFLQRELPQPKEHERRAPSAADEPSLPEH